MGPVIPALVVVVVLGAVALAVAAVLRRRRPAAPEEAPSWAVPTQVDRTDFTGADRPWLVAVFASSTCTACAATADKAVLLESSAVAVQVIDDVADRATHERYRVEAVPMVVIADGEGLVRRSFLGEPTATDLWAALAELREPGTVPESCTGN